MDKQKLISSLQRHKFDKQIINSFESVPRENFIPKNLQLYAYEDNAQPIGHGQTISQPYTIAVMLQMLNVKKGQKVLEIGSGCGYVLALLSEIVKEKGKVFGVEIIRDLFEKLKQNLLDYENVEVFNRNGSLGLEERAPFNRILISAALNEIPQELKNQLKEKGIIVAPVNNHGISFGQSLISYQKQKGKLILKEKKPGFVFVRFV